MLVDGPHRSLAEQLQFRVVAEIGAAVVHVVAHFRPKLLRGVHTMRAEHRDDLRAARVPSEVLRNEGAEACIVPRALGRHALGNKPLLPDVAHDLQQLRLRHLQLA